MNKRIKKKKMNLFLKRRGDPHAMRIQDVSLFIPVPINDLYRKYVEDRTRENKNKRLAIVERRAVEEYDKRRKKLIDKIKNGDTGFNNIGEDGGPTMDYRIQSYADYGAAGPIEPVILVEGESKSSRHNKRRNKK